MLNEPEHRILAHMRLSPAGLYTAASWPAIRELRSLMCSVASHNLSGMAILSAPVPPPIPRSS